MKEKEKKVYYPGTGERMIARLKAIGYEKPDAKYGVDVETFCWDARLGRTNVYNWLDDIGMPTKDLTRLCDVLGCSERWLLVGAERDAPKKADSRQGRGKARSLLLALGLGAGAALWPSGSVRAHDGTTQVANYIGEILLIGSWRRFRNYFRYFGTGMAYAL